MPDRASRAAFPTRATPRGMPASRSLGSNSRSTLRYYDTDLSKGDCKRLYQRLHCRWRVQHCDQSAGSSWCGATFLAKLSVDLDRDNLKKSEQKKPETKSSHEESPEGMEPEEKKPQEKKPEEQKSSQGKTSEENGPEDETRPEEKRSQDKEPGKKEVALCSQFRRPRDLCWSEGQNIFCPRCALRHRLIHIRRGRPLVPRRDPRVTQTGISALCLEAVALATLTPRSSIVRSPGYRTLPSSQVSPLIIAARPSSCRSS
jgi:hypothetical protein